MRSHFVFVVVKKYSPLIVKRQGTSNYYNVISREWKELKDATWFDVYGDAEDAIFNLDATDGGIYQVEKIYLRL